MDAISLTELADDLLASAKESRAGRHSRTLYGGQEHHLRQTLVALRGGTSLQEHDNPGEATVHVLTGRVVLVAGDERAELGAGGHLVIPQERHSVEATEDSVLLLTTSLDATRVHPPTSNVRRD